MPTIQQLSPHVADLIAAGEVVERPASAVKELIENAIDASASAVVVEIAAGGRGSIRITDNGCGIAPEELPTAFLRHATSKLHTPQDLAAIGTLGFRGEALAAIAAVSRVEVVSRQRDAEAGAGLTLEAGVPGKVETAGCPVGTTIVVRDLFYNTPARQKFLKSDSAEASAVASVVGQIALSHPELSLRYIRDGKEELYTPGDGKLLSAIYAVRGRDFAKTLQEVSGGGDGVMVRGYVTEPLAGRGSRGMQTFFCCGRLIKSSLLTAALEEAYANRQMKGKFPGCVLHIDLPLYEVDVNVHPAKTVVKFAKEREVFSAVHHVVRDALDAAGRPEKASPPPAMPTNARGDFYQTMDAATFREKASAGNLARRESRGPVSLAPAARSTGSGSELAGRIAMRDGAAPRFNGQPVVSREALTPVSSAFSRKSDEELVIPIPVKENPLSENTHLQIKKSREEKSEASRWDAPQRETPRQEQTQQEPPRQESLLPEEPVPWRYAGEIFHTYILAEAGEELYLIDKHAAHERLNFDRLKSQDRPVMRQTLMTSLAVELPGEQYAVLLENLPVLERLGFEAEDFGTGCLMVRAIPDNLDTGAVGETLESLAQTLLETATLDPNAARDALYHTMACKSAIKGGWTSDPSELQILIDAVQSGKIQFCPHGRPVAVKVTKHQLEKMFKRA